MEQFDRGQAKPRGFVARRLDLNAASARGHAGRPKAAPARREDSSDDDSPYPKMNAKSRVPDWRRAKEANGTSSHSNALFDKLGIAQEDSDSDASSWEGSPIKSHPAVQHTDERVQKENEAALLQLQTQLATAQLSAAQAMEQLSLEKASNAGLQQEITSSHYEIQCLRRTAAEHMELAEQQDIVSSQTELLRRQVTSLQASSERVEAERSALMAANESLLQELNEARVRATVAEDKAQRAAEAVAELTNQPPRVDKEVSMKVQVLEEQLRVTQAACENTLLRLESAEGSLMQALADKEAAERQTAESFKANENLKASLAETKSDLLKAQEQHMSASSNTSQVIAEMQTQLAQARTEESSKSATLQRELAATRTELQLKAQELDDARHQHAIEMHAVRSELSDTAQAAQLAHAQLSSLQNDFKIARSAADDTIAALRAAVTEAQTVAAERESQLLDAQQEVLNHINAVTSLREQFARLEAEEVEQSAALALAVEQRAAAETKAAGFEAILHNAWNDRDAALSQSESFKSRAVELETELCNVRCQLESAVGQSVDTDSKMAALEAEIKSAQSEVDVAIQSNAVSEARIATLQAELRTAVSERDSALAELQRRTIAIPADTLNPSPPALNQPISAQVFTQDTFWTGSNATREGLVERKRSTAVGDLETGSAYDTDSSDDGEERGALVSLAMRWGAPASAVAASRWVDGALGTARQVSYKHQRLALTGILLYALLVHIALATGWRCGGAGSAT